MQINNKFIYLKRRDSFDEIINFIPTDLNPIIFIEETSQLYTCGTFFNLGYPSIDVSEINGQIKVDIGQEHFFLNTTGESLSIRKGDGNKIIINSSALTKISTSGPLEWNDFTKTLSHKMSGVSVGEYGQIGQVSNASILSIPYFTTNETGHIVNAGTSGVQIRDYVEQIAAGTQNIERSILQSYNPGFDVSDTAQTRKTNGLTYNDNLQRLSVPGGIKSNGSVEIIGGDLKVTNGVIIGNLQGDISGSATPKIHLAENPEYGGASKSLYGHVVLQDNLPGIKPPESSNNVNVTNSGVTAVAASPLMVWNALEEAKEYSDSNGLIINAINEEGYKEAIKKFLNFTDDFIIDDNNNLFLKWEEIS